MIAKETVQVLLEPPVDWLFFGWPRHVLWIGSGEHRLQQHGGKIIWKHVCYTGPDQWIGCLY
jgi:hypothetical protein